MKMIEDSTLKVQVKTKFGLDMIQPMCEKSKVFAEMVGKQSLNISQLAMIKRLGFDVEFVAQTVEI